MTIVLETERLRIRRFTEDDAPLLLELDSDPEVMRFVGPYQLPNVEAYREYIRARYLPEYQRQAGWGVFAAIEMSSGNFLGKFILHPAPQDTYGLDARFQPDDIELGFRFRRDCWGRGFATEGSRALIRLAFRQNKATRIVAAILDGNIASVRVLEKVGLKLISRSWANDVNQPQATFALTAEEFLSAESTPAKLG
jgi:RimJ/RimL family protein N-acetyltransferase